MDETTMATTAPPVVEEVTIHGTPQFVGKLYGVELEIEAEGLYQVQEEYDEEEDTHLVVEAPVPAGWLREQEDSILGVELISERPFSFETSVENINRVFADIDRLGFSPIRTPRGSTHVHANVADLTWEQMKSFVTACAWAESTLIELAGKGRKGNLFAQSYETTPVGWANIIDWCRKEEMYQQSDTHYMATSFYPMTYLGSVEFRMGPSARNAEDAIRWLSCIHSVVTAGRETEVGLEEPSFLQHLMSKFEPKKQEQLRAKGAKQASEVWWAMQEKYERPLRGGPKKSGLSIGELAAYMTNMQAVSAQPTPVPPAPSINFFDEYQSAIEDASYSPSPIVSNAPIDIWLNEAGYPTPPSDAPLACNCGSPDCPINFPNNFNNSNSF